MRSSRRSAPPRSASGMRSGRGYWAPRPSPWSRSLAGVTSWETVVGLEVHAELATASKLFCACPNEFGGEPNTHICPVCLGLPGSLPVLNEQAVVFALRVAEALHLQVPEHSVFARKNYFYPDMPKNYQTSKYDAP